MSCHRRSMDNKIVTLPYLPGVLKSTLAFLLPWHPPHFSWLEEGVRASSVTSAACILALFISSHSLMIDYTSIHPPFGVVLETFSYLH